MKYFKALPSLLLLAVAVCAQQDPGYNYKKPVTPRGTYLPPTTQKPFRPESEQNIDAQGLNPDGEHEPGMPYDFTYAVKDDVGNDFSHQAESDGDIVKGEYRTALPDGRIQIVKYTADWKNGYNAEVTYEGEANYPEPPPQKPTRNPYESDQNIDSQGLRPNKPAPARNPPPPPQRPTQPPRTQAPPRQTQPPRTQPPRTTQPPPPPPGLYGAPSVPFGVRNNPKFGYSRK